ncbi:tyrosine-type recombinase/integrase [Marinobacterium stanieri]|uniref:Site-specific recombinase XerD n=1 Tax=Marinobacterium stanieri TaxID=49186 RepID=A0A1N6U7T3_9GAMM|nr:integrase arm-type DNA-binding domain-containing protein [Marinobacterium stanieri]SIQ61561.1 Site-specific recombinase XerD [Marinobacterium stanieri]
MKSTAVKLTKSVVESLEPRNKQYTQRDTSLTGFGVRVSPKGTKSFVYENRVNGRFKRVTIGRFPALTVDQARKMASKLVGDMVQGIDPNSQKQEAKRRGLPLKQAVDEYLERGLKEDTKKDVVRAMKHLSDWMDKPITEITPAMTVQRHKKISKGAKSSGARANLVMRYLRAILNFASKRHATAEGVPLLVSNPVQRLSAEKAWNRVKRRRTFIQPHQMQQWYQAVTEGLIGMRFELEYRDCLLLSMMTGVRPGEAISLRWSGVDLAAGVLTFPDTKNHSDHRLPITRFIRELLTGRQSLSGAHEFVFSNQGGQRPKEVRGAMERIEELTGLHVMPTDLRRTFITAAERLDIGPYTLKAMLNHAIGDDVTAGYLVITVDRLREPMQRIEDALLRDAGVLPTNVLPFEPLGSQRLGEMV